MTTISLSSEYVHTNKNITFESFTLKHVHLIFETIHKGENMNRISQGGHELGSDFRVGIIDEVLVYAMIWTLTVKWNGADMLFYIRY